MQPFLDKLGWEKALKGFEITDIAIREKNILYLCGRKAISNDEASHLLDHQIPSRIIALYLDRKAGENCGYQEIVGMNYPVLGVSRAPFSRPSGLLASRDKDGDTWPHGGGSGPMEQIAPGEWPFPEKLKCINGHTYSVGSGRRVYKRLAVGQWQLLKSGIPQVESTSKLGFRDMDAFSESDMYAVGGHGDVWHYDGMKWKQMGFPSNVQLGTVTCAGDGNVYISGEGGSLWIGQKSTWKRIYEGGSSVLWNDALWFQDKLWLASDYHFRIWNGKGLEPVAHDGEQIYISGHMDVHDGLLAITSLHDVMTFDGKVWRTIIAPYPD